MTLKSVNDRLTELGINARMEKGDGYFYFRWRGNGLAGPNRPSAHLEQPHARRVVDEFTRLKKLNEGMLLPPPKKKGT